MQSSGNQWVIKLLFKMCLVGVQKGVSKASKGHLLQAYWASFRSQKSMFWKVGCENIGQIMPL